MDSMWSTAALKPNPLNIQLYEEQKLDSPQMQDLIKSIQENGLLEALVCRPDGTLLSGHRRLLACRHLGLEQVPVKVIEEGDDRVLIVEYNRQRIKTVSEMMREAELVQLVAAEKAAMNRLGRGNPIAPEDRIVARDIAAEAVGMKPRTFSKAKAVFDLAKVNEYAKDKLDRVDSGELSIHAAFKALRPLMKGEPDGEETELPDFIRFYNSWQFASNDPRFGIPHPGQIPGQIAGNLIYYFTEPGDLVVDPMAGGGSTLDVAAFLERECLAYDVVPRRPDIARWDISKGFPEECQEAQLIFMDPPYWNMMDEGYADESASRLELSEFHNWYEKLLHDASKTVRVGGFVAVINMGQYFRLPPTFRAGYIDWPIVSYNYLLDAGMAPWARIAVTYPTTLHGGFQVDAAKKGKYLLPILGDIVVTRRLK